jgi:hypothetical protein
MSDPNSFYGCDIYNIPQLTFFLVLNCNYVANLSYTCSLDQNFGIQDLFGLT